MSILIQDFLFIGAALVYLGLSFHFWRTRWSGQAPDAGTPMRPWERAVAGIAIGLHGLGLKFALFGDPTMKFSFALALSTMFWLAAALYWLENLRAKLEALQPLVLGLAGAFVLLPLLFGKTHVLSHAGNLGFRLHFSAAMLAYSLFALSVLQAAFLHFAERRLHQRSLSRGLAALPSILTLESMLFRMIGLGFALLTFAVGSGVFFSREIYEKPLSIDHKTLFAIISWIIFAALLAGRWRFGWRGRTAQRWLFSGFAALILAYVGSRFVLEVILGR